MPWSFSKHSLERGELEAEEGGLFAEGFLAAFAVEFFFLDEDGGAETEPGGEVFGTGEAFDAGSDLAEEGADTRVRPSSPRET